MICDIKGFPEVSKPVEMPSVGELLVAPMLYFATPEEVYKYASSAVKYLFDKTPIKNDRKYVFVNSTIQFLTPNVRTIPNATKDSGNNWHIDNFASLDSDRMDRFHMIFSDCSALTEFNINSFKMDIGDGKSGALEATTYIVNNEDKLPLISRKVVPHAFITFSDHIHRRTTPQHHEFRYWLRVIETDIYPPNRNNVPICDTSYVVGERGGTYTNQNDVVLYKNIVQSKDRVIIHIT